MEGGEEEGREGEEGRKGGREGKDEEGMYWKLWKAHTCTYVGKYNGVHISAFDLSTTCTCRHRLPVVYLAAISLSSFMYELSLEQKRGKGKTMPRGARMGRE